MEFIESLVRGCLCPFAVDIVVYDILRRAGEAQKDAVVAMRIGFGGSSSQFPNGDGASKCSNLAEVRDCSIPGLMGGFSNCAVVGVIVEVSGVNKGVSPKFCSKAGAVQHTAYHVGKSTVWPFTTAILG